MARAIDARICFTPRYGKSAAQGQLRQRNCSNALRKAGSGWKAEFGRKGRIRLPVPARIGAQQ
jgi:hypothetical protein